MIRQTALLATLSTPLAAQEQDLSFDGLWRSNPTADCAVSEGNGGAIRIEDGTLVGAGNSCEMTRPTNVRDMNAILYDMVCEAEDDAFTERAMLLEGAEGGLYLIWNGFTFKYEACGEPVEGAVTTSDQLGITD